MLRASKRSVLALGLSASVFAAVALPAAPAAAHGAFPQSVSFSKDPSDPTRFWMGTSFGLATSSDSGATWSWLCEEAPDYEGYEPALAVTADGSLVVGSFGGLSVSHDNGCSWDNPENSPTKMVSDVYVEDAGGGSVLGLFSMSDGEAYLNQVWSSSDNARTWTQVGANIDSTLLLSTARSAPSDTDTLYVSGKRFFEDFTSEPVAIRSRNRGQTWEEIPVPDGGAPRLLAVHPEQPGTVFLRIQGSDEEALDTLWVSNDFGDTWKDVHSAKARLYGFAFSPDLTEVWLGLGDPRDVSVMDDDQGVWVGDIDTFDFQRVQEGPIGCLTSTDTGLYICTRQFYHLFELARVDQPGDPLQGLWELDKLKGVAECPVDTDVSKLCHAKWPETCFLTSQCGGESGAGGSGNTGGGAGTGGLGANDSDPAPSGCACRAAGAGAGHATGPLGHTPAGTTALFGLLGAWFLRRRRR
jgi:hypothetical protein